MLGRIDCEECEGEGTDEVAVVGGGWVTIDCEACKGAGSFEVYGPLTREDSERRTEAEAAWQAWSDALVKHECTHCDRQGFEAMPQPPAPCGSCPDGIVAPLRELQAAAHPVLPWRREGDQVVAVPPTPLRDLHAMLDHAGITKGSLGQRIAAALQDRQAWMDAADRLAVERDAARRRCADVGALALRDAGQAGEFDPKAWAADEWGAGVAERLYATDEREPPKEPTDG